MSMIAAQETDRQRGVHFMDNNYMGTSEAGKLWGRSQAAVSKACREGKIQGAEQDGPGKPWRIPADAPNPFVKSGEDKK